MQLELFPAFNHPSDQSLITYWRDALESWPRDVFEWRHYRDTTGWSMASGGYSFARILFEEGKMTRRQFKRWWKFNRRVQRWDRK